jgi:hypothetical protein|tara:strand:+ start:6724 stop:6861 length:138 start_codon:yes stop_codon:yes gene_type:complete
MKAGERIRRRWPDPAAAAAGSAMADPLAPLLQHLHRSWQESPADP